MRYLADLHIHSCYSRATSKTGNLHGLAAWARVKGINLLGTGDFTHPAWLSQLKNELQPAGPGLFKLKVPGPEAWPGVKPEDIEPHFMLTSEISCIYKRHGRVRKVHNLIMLPDFAGVERLNRRLAAIGNLESDGRPILGLDSHDLLEILLEEAPNGFLVPAHIWTPWFSLFGSRSGFDSIEECYGDMAEHIFALETGLSSDPDMNRCLSALDRYTLISNSDCHSPARLGRELNIFACDFDFFSLRRALENPGDGGFKGTVEFYPEEGKYYFDGHRKCRVCMDPLRSHEAGGICPVCGRPMTIGVAHRLRELADREQPVYPAGQPGYRSIIPLPEVLGEILARGAATKGVRKLYNLVINRFGSEFNILLRTPLDDLRLTSPVLAEAVSRIRSKRVIRQAGFDGEFGVIKLFESGELDSVRPISFN
ncbi:endonuclease Q family protein [Desulfobacterota bacterium M19]